VSRQPEVRVQHSASDAHGVVKLYPAKRCSFISVISSLKRDCANQQNLHTR
jgi:hypothetical protein